MQRDDQSEDRYDHSHNARWYYGDCGQYAWVLPLLGDGKRRHSYPDGRWMDRGGKSGGNACEDRWRRTDRDARHHSADGADCDALGGVVERYECWGQRFVQHKRRFAIEWHEQRAEGDCSDQQFGRGLGYADAAF